MAKNDRFVKVYTQSGFTQGCEIWADTVTGVHYLYIQNGYGGGLSPLLGADGKPVVSYSEIPANDQLYNQ